MRLLKLARGVCSGMEYLSAVGYVHRVSATNDSCNLVSNTSFNSHTYVAKSMSL